MNSKNHDTVSKPVSLLAGLALIVAGPWAAAAPDLSRVNVPEGFKVTLFAAPPDIGYPTCLAATPGGALFVGIDENGSIDREPNRGRIVHCTDQDDDGQADQFVVVVPNVDSPRGIIWDQERIYVLHPPRLTSFIDDDRDGVADRSEVLVEGIGFDLGFRGADHTSNGIQLGIDGWIYVAIGDYGFLQAQAKDGEVMRLRGGGVVRVRPDGSELELVAQGLRNIYDVAISPSMDLFTRDNTNDGGGWNVRLSHILELANYGYPRLFKHFEDEIMPALADYGGGSPCGSLYVDESILPEPYGNTLYTCDWGRSIVYRHPLVAQGASFAPTQEKFVEISRPTDMDVDGRGNIYISSWDGGQFTYAGPNVGFIVRVQPEGLNSPPFPDVTRASEKDLLTMLATSSHVRRLSAQREILRRRSQPTIVAELQSMARGNRPLEQRIAAVFTLKQLQGSTSHPFLVRLTQDESIREFALRALADRASETKQVPTEPFLSALRQPNPRVQRQAIHGLVRLGARETASAILPLTESPDRAISHTAFQALVQMRAVDTCLNALDNPQSEPITGALRVLRQLHTARTVEGLADRLGQAEDPELRSAMLTALIRLYYLEPEWKGGWWGTRPDTTGPYYEQETWDESERIKKIILQTLQQATPSLINRLCLELARHRIAWEEVVPIMLEYADESTAIRRATMEMLSRQSSPSPAALPLLRQALSSASEPVETIALALSALRKMPGDEAWNALWAALPGLAVCEDPSRELERALNGLLRDPSVYARVESFTKLATDESVSPALRELAYVVLLNANGRRSRAPEPVQQAAEATLSTASSNPMMQVPLLRAISRTRQRQYESVVRQGLASGNPEIKQAAQEAARALRIDLTTTHEGSGDPLANLVFEDIVKTVATTPGDSNLGRDLFDRQLCVSCHTVSSEEPLKGPFLGGIAKRYNRFELSSSILRPSAQIAQGFETHFFDLTDGESVEGFVVREAGNEVEIRNAAGAVVVIDKKDIAQRGTRQTSMMPEGLATNLTVQEFASLLAFLESLESQ